MKKIFLLFCLVAVFMVSCTGEQNVSEPYLDLSEILSYMVTKPSAEGGLCSFSLELVPSAIKRLTEQESMVPGKIWLKKKGDRLALNWQSSFSSKFEGPYAFVFWADGHCCIMVSEQEHYNTLLDFFKGLELREMSIAEQVTKGIKVQPSTNPSINDLRNPKVVIDGHVVGASFSFESFVSSDYFLSAFICPENHSVYRVLFNGEDLHVSLVPNKPGWQSIRLVTEEGNLATVPVLEGINEIEIYSSRNDFPEIEFLRLGLTEDDAFISSQAYDEYIEKIKKGLL